METTPTAKNTTLAEELLPCTRMPLCESLLYEGHARADCPAVYRPTVALALQSKDDSAALEIDRLKGEIIRLTVRLQFYADPQNYRKTVRWGKPKSVIDDDGGSVARAALQTEGGKSE